MHQKSYREELRDAKRRQDAAAAKERAMQDDRTRRLSPAEAPDVCWTERHEEARSGVYSPGCRIAYGLTKDAKGISIAPRSRKERLRLAAAAAALSGMVS